jgi:hypothetical protein
MSEFPKAPACGFKNDSSVVSTCSSMESNNIQQSNNTKDNFENDAHANGISSIKREATRGDTRKMVSPPEVIIEVQSTSKKEENSSNSSETLYPWKTVIKINSFNDRNLKTNLLRLPVKPIAT